MARKKLTSLDKTLAKFTDGDGDSPVVKGFQAAGWKFCPTDSPALNEALSKAGVPCGAIITIGGKSSSGKTALALNVLGSFQRNIHLSGKLDRDGDPVTEGNVMLLDAERSFTHSWYSRTGLGIGAVLKDNEWVDDGKDNFRVIQSNEGEVTLDIVQEAVNSGLYDAILVDSTTALVPMADLAENSDLSDQNMALLARLLSRHLKRIKNLARKRECTVIYIAQPRKNMEKYQNFIESLGANAIQFYSDQIWKVSRTSWIGKEEDPEGVVSKVSCVKNKVSKPGKSASFSLYFDGDTAFNYDMDYVDSAIMITEEAEELNLPIYLVKKSGGWFTLLDDNNNPIKVGKEEALKVQGKDKFLKALKEIDYIPTLRLRIHEAQTKRPDEELVEDIKEEDVEA